MQYHQRPRPLITLLSVIMFSSMTPLYAQQPEAVDYMAVIERMDAELTQLREEVQALRSEQQETWLTERRAQEVRGLIHDVLADAQTRATLLNDGVLAGHDGRTFFLANADNSFRLNISGQLMMRYIFNFRDEPDAGRETTSGFQMRRTRVVFSGHIADPRLTFRIQPEVRRADGRMSIADVYIGYRFTDELSLQAGRYKVPFWKEDMHSSSRQLAVERSLVNAVFSGARSTGVMASYRHEDVRLYGMVGNGFGTGLHDFTGDLDRNAAQVALTGRGEVKLAGDWSQYNHFAGWRDDPFGLILGGAVHWEHNRAIPFGAGAGDTRFGDTQDFFTWTIDASLYMENFALYGALVGRHDTKTLADAPRFDDYGLLLQGGYTIDDKVQPFVRYEWLIPDNTRNDHDIHLITMGVNYFFAGHSAKLTTDVVWVLNPLNGFTGGSGGLGLLTDGTGEKNQLVWRTQFQLLF